MEKKLWMLRPDYTSDNLRAWVSSDWEKLHGIIVRAETENRARRIAQTFAGRECENHPSNEPWLDRDYTTCTEVSTSGKSEAVLVDFYGG